MTTVLPLPREGTIGSAVDRVDGGAKVQGRAQYASDAPIEGAAFATLVGASIARGTIRAIETADALAVRGVLRIITHENAPRLTQPKPSFADAVVPAQTMMPLQEARIVHYGQQVALVVAETLEAARAAAGRIRVAYAPEPAVLSLHDPSAERFFPEDFFGDALQSGRGDVDRGFADAEVRLDATYTTPSEHHTPMEPHATVARWDGEKLVVYDATQWVMGTRNYLAGCFGIPAEDVRVICPFVGGGFGSKGFGLPHTVLAAVAARMSGRPVKLVLTRAQVMTETGSRPQTEQRVRAGARRDGTLLALDHASLISTSYAGDFFEPCGLTSASLYSCPNVRISHEAVRLNVCVPTPMRAPGETPGMFALESALDELAVALDLDPVDLRIRNEPDRDESTGLPWSGRHFVAALQAGAERFGWDDRPRAPRERRDGDELVGWGVAAATYGGLRAPASALARAEADGRVVVEVATHDLGTGMYTIMAQVAAETLGVPLERVECRLGDSAFPPAPVAGGSQSTASVMPAVQAACAALRERAQAAAGAPADYAAAARAAGGTLAVRRDAAPGDEQQRYAFRSFGAHFVDVRVDEALGRIRVARVVSAFDCGRILNPKTARSQLVGGIIFGIGQALMEEDTLDPRTGRLLSDNLSEYRIPVNADTGAIDVLFVEEPDYLLNPLGARGIGEIGITGIAAAIANAVYHATGKRVRELPILPEKLL